MDCLKKERRGVGKKIDQSKPDRPEGYALGRCSQCGREFECNNHCHNSPNDCSGPCCSNPPHGNDNCWKEMPYFEEWKAGRYEE